MSYYYDNMIRAHATFFCVWVWIPRGLLFECLRLLMISFPIRHKDTLKDLGLSYTDIFQDDMDNIY